MRFFEVVLSGAALMSAALAVELNSWPSSVKAGESVTLTYSPKDAATTILLRKGPATDLTTLQTLTTTSTGGSFTFVVPSNLENADDYAFEIDQAGEVNYSGHISLSGGVASAVSSSAGYSTAQSSSSSASAASSSAAYSTAPASSSAYSTEVATTVKTSVVTSAASGVASASGSLVPSYGVNSTISTGAPTATTSSSSPPVVNTGAASSFGVNAAALFGAMGALAYFA